MKIVPKETACEDSSRQLRETASGRGIRECGVFTWPAGLVAHEGERHVHEHDEVFLVLAGALTVPITGGPSGIAHAGDWVLVEAGEEHHLTNHTGGPATAAYFILD